MNRRQRAFGIGLEGGAATLVAVALSAALTLPTTPAAAAVEPCGGVQLQDGSVRSKKPLPATADLEGADAACAAAVAALLKARPRLRSVTVAARVASDQRTAGAAIAAAWSKAIADAGVPAARISTIVPTAPPGTAASVSIAYREPQPRPVALVQAMTGEVKAGLEVAALTSASKGSKLTQGEHVATGGASVARLALADGSFVALLPNTLIRLGRVELTRDLKRAVRIDLLRGKVEAIAEPRGEGSAFDVVTRTAVAGVRGTRFRVGLAETGATAVETVTGAVELQAAVGAKASVLVKAGSASRVDEAGEPSKPRALLPATVVDGPLKGPVQADAVLRWRAVEGARRYLVEVGGDGELATDHRSFEAEKPALELPKALAAGHWFWRVSPVDDAGFVGMPSKTYSFTRAGAEAGAKGTRDAGGKSR